MNEGTVLSWGEEEKVSKGVEMCVYRSICCCQTTNRSSLHSAALNETQTSTAPESLSRAAPLLSRRGSGKCAAGTGGRSLSTDCAGERRSECC